MTRCPKCHHEWDEHALALSITSARDIVLEHYLKLHPRAKPGAKEKRLIHNRLSDGFTAANLCAAIDGCHKSTFHVENGHLQLALIMRDASHVERFMLLADKPGMGREKSKQDTVEASFLRRFGQ